MSERKNHVYRVKPRRTALPEGGKTLGEDTYDGSADARPARVAAEVERQRNIYRPGTSDAILQRAAIAALMERGEY